ncbi:transcription factor FapR [Thermoflavimicrobium dichotomicum]|uniref:Transcription factor FapR n=1 Tax=Thermoflavimicrobium dichotomicum TaxID=46223 RepID=A0A1I3SS51_9BACL|nr:transcription factor FapR [Thermoflavimicrobium dichotomicum]SFJ61170.1 Acyl-coenzyme A thioesterase PaaI, contains HGG motif [Thermoflavimicrobium dichotomicum]
MRLSKKERQKKLIRELEADPFLTDEQMAKLCNVSIQTIRLDRMELGIPELRERIKHMAEKNFDQVRSLSPQEVIGEVIDLQLDKSGVSILEIRKEHVFERNGIARGHYLFAQANSLAIGLVDAEIALTAAAEIRFVRPVRLGEKCMAYAKVVEVQSSRTKVEVQTKVNNEVVFYGLFEVYRTEEDQLAKEER